MKKQEHLTKEETAFYLDKLKNGTAYEREVAGAAFLPEIDFIVTQVINSNFATFTALHDDMMSEGKIAAYKALISKYDPEMGPLKSYLSYAVTNAIREFLTSTVTESSHYYYQTSKAIIRVANKHHFNIDSLSSDNLALISQELEIPISRITNALERTVWRHKISLEDELTGLIPDPHPTPEEEYLKSETMTEISKALTRLEPEEQMVFRLRHGLGFEPLGIKAGVEMKSSEIEAMLSEHGVYLNTQYLYNKARQKLRRDPNLRGYLEHKNVYAKVVADIHFDFFNNDLADELLTALEDVNPND